MSEAFKIEDIFAENVFTVAKMKERLPKKVFANLKNVMDNGLQYQVFCMIVKLLPFVLW